MKSFNCSITHTHGIQLFILFIIISTSLFQFSDAQTTSDSPDDDYALEGNKVNPSMAIIIIVLVIGFFITGCISIYISQCSDNSPIGDPAGINARNGNSIRANMRGLEQSVIDTFPTFVYSDVKELRFGKETLECAVCLNEFEEHETLRLLPKCDHVFHSECIDAWLTGHSTCPVCRASLIPDSIESLTKEESHHEMTESSPMQDDLLEVTVVPTVVPKSRVPRSHSTGHSLACTRQDHERFTLRLPDEVRKQLMVAPPKLKRATSLVALPRVSSSKRGYRNGGGGDGSGSSRYGRFFGRSFKWTTTRNNGGEEGSTRSKRFFSTVVTPVQVMPRVPV